MSKPTAALLLIVILLVAGGGLEWVLKALTLAAMTVVTMVAGA